MYTGNNKEETSNRNRVVDIIPSIKELVQIGGPSEKKRRSFFTQFYINIT